MNRLMLFVLCIPLLISGCSTYESYRMVKHTFLDPTALDVVVQRHENHYERETPNNGSLYVLWSAHLISAKQAFSGIYIYLDGSKTSAVLRGTYAVIELPPGIYEVSVGDSDNIKSTKSITIKENEDTYYRTGIQSNPLSPDSLFLSKFEGDGLAKTLIKKSRYVTLE